MGNTFKLSSIIQTLIQTELSFNDQSDRRMRDDQAPAAPVAAPAIMSPSGPV